MRLFCGLYPSRFLFIRVSEVRVVPCPTTLPTKYLMGPVQRLWGGPSFSCRNWDLGPLDTSLQWTRSAKAHTRVCLNTIFQSRSTTSAANSEKRRSWMSSRRAQARSSTLKHASVGLWWVQRLAGFAALGGEGLRMEKQSLAEQQDIRFRSVCVLSFRCEHDGNLSNGQRFTDRFRCTSCTRCCSWEYLWTAQALCW